MPLLAVLLLLVVAVAAGYYYGRDAGKPDEETTAVTQRARSWAGTVKGWTGTASETARSWAGSASETAKSWTGSARKTAGNWTGTARGWVGKSKREAEQLRAWLAALPGVNKAFKTWLEGLAPKEAEQFTKEISDFGASLNVDRDWLLSGEVDDDPALKKGVEEAMASYCMAYWNGLQVQDNAAVLATFEAWQKAPFNRKNRELSQSLFTRMVDDGLISAPAELYMASEKERRTYVVQSILDFAEKDRSAFNAILKEATSAPVEEPPAPEKKPQPKVETAPAPA
jgi:hypothetical protein